MAKHIAFKCTYNDGGEGNDVGFADTCSETNIKHNIDQHHIWCSKSDCNDYYKHGFKGHKPTPGSCYESDLFTNWEFGCGMYHNGHRRGCPIPVSHVAKDQIAVLTTRFPGDDEIDRKIIGLFLIGFVKKASGDSTKLIAAPKYRIRLPLEEAKNLYFWDYYKTKGGARWGTGLFRYMTDQEVAAILNDLALTLRESRCKTLVGELLQRPEFARHKNCKAQGARHKIKDNRAKQIAVIRKYGSGGEGKDHKELKEWVAHNPKFLKLSNITQTHIEYVFPSGDCADIVFDIANHRHAVVEIETTLPGPGFYQSLKYRVLKCAESRVSIVSPRVKAYIVAWNIPSDVKKLCSKYRVAWKEKKLSKQLQIVKR